MPSRKKLNIDGIAFDLGSATPVALERLATWVVWQFPRLRAGQYAGYCGAVHPVEPEHGWYPAVIDAAAGQVFVFANAPERFASPEAASKHLDQLAE